MISQSCPRCGSNRIRPGYRHTPMWKKIIGRYNLLCNTCNWEFTGFAMPGTVESHSERKKRKKRPGNETAENAETTELDKNVENSDQTSERREPAATSIDENKRRVRVKKRVKVKLKD